MDTISELKQRARTLEAKGDDAGALKVYASIPPEKMEAGLVGRMAAVQVRVGKIAEAVRSHQRSVAKLMKEGLHNAAIYNLRQLLEIDPDNVEGLLRLGQLTGASGYRRDAVEAFTRYLSLLDGGGEMDDLLAALDRLPTEHRAAVVEPLRAELVARDPAVADRVEAMLASDAGAPALQDSAGGGGAEAGLISTALGGDEDAGEIEPLPGLETGPAADAGLPPLLGDLPLLESSADAEEEEEEGEVDDRVAAIPGLDDLDSLQTAPVESTVEDEAETSGGDLDFLLDAGEDAEEDGDDLPFLGAGTETPAAETAGTEVPAAAEEWVDLGAMILGDDDEEQMPAPAAGGAGADAAEGDFSELLRELGAAPIDDGEDVGSRYDLGLAYKEMGLLDAAISQLHGALAAGDNPLASLEVLGECYLERGDYQEACLALNRATELETSSETDLLGVRYLLGRCEEALGEVEAARASYGQVVAIEPAFRDAAARLEKL